MKFKHRLIMGILTVLSVLILAVGTALSAYPEKAVKMIVAFGVGGSTDIIARTYEQLFRNEFGQPMLVTNKPGAGGAVGWSEVVNSRADGYTLTLVSLSIGGNYGLGNIPFSGKDSFTHIAQVAVDPLIFAVRSDSPHKTAQDLFAYAKAHPNEVLLGASGLGGIVDVANKSFTKETGIQFRYVPHMGGGEITTALMGGHVAASLQHPSEMMSQLKAGLVRPLAILSKERSSLVGENIPTLKELGYNVIFQQVRWLAGPKGISSDIVKKLAGGTKNILAKPEYQALIKSLAIEIVFDTGKEWEEYLHKQILMMEEAARATKVKK